MTATPSPLPGPRFNFAAHLLSLNEGRAEKAAFVDDLGTLRYRELAQRVRELAADGRATVTVCAASPGATSVTIRWGGLTSTTGELTRVIRSIELLDDTAGVTADGRGITGSFRVAD